MEKETKIKSASKMLYESAALIFKYIVISKEVFMQLTIESKINIESENSIDTMLMLNNHTIRPSYFASFDPRSPFLNIDQNPAHWFSSLHRP